MLQANNGAMHQKSQMLPNSSMASQSIVNPQFKQQLAGANQAHLITAAGQSSMLNQAQLLGSLQQLPHGLAWTTGPAPSALMATPNSQIFIRSGQPATDGQQQLFIQSSTQPIQTMGGTPIYVNHNPGAMHLMSAAAASQPHMSELHQPMISTSEPSTSASQLITTMTSQSITSSAQTAPNNSIVNLNSSNRGRHRLSSSSSLAIQGPNSAHENGKSNNHRSKMGSMSTAVGLSNFSASPASNRPSSVGSQHSSRDTSTSLNHSLSQSHQKILTQKSTQQMNAELLLKSANATKMKHLVRSDSTRSLNSQGSEDSKFGKNGGEHSKKVKDDSKHLNGKKLERRELSTENIEMNASKSQTNGGLKKSEKKKLGLNKASNKSQVLTHCIDGHIILESSVPFPVLSNLSQTLRDRSNGIVNQANDSRLVAVQENIASKSNQSSSSMDTSSNPAASALPKEVRIKNKKLKKAKLKAANQAALLARSNGQMEDNKGHLQLSNPPTIVPISGTLIPFDGVVTQAITIPKASPLGSAMAQLPSQLADQSLSVCTGSNLSHSSSVINGILVNDSVMELDDSGFMHKQKISSTPIKETHSSMQSEPTSTTLIGGTGHTDRPVYMWSAQDVYDYVTKVSSAEYAKVLLDHYIDGRALLLLTVPIMKDELKLKLGPVLVLKAKIDELRDKFAELDSEANYLPAERNIYKWTVSRVHLSL
jgi:hypothetical protein